MRLWLLGVALAIMILGYGCEDAGAPPPAPPEIIAPVTLSFQTNIYPILSQTSYGCMGCHTGGGSIGWYVSGNASATRSNLVNVNANTGSCTTLKRVLPGDATQSALYLRLAGTTCGDRMPQGGNAISSSHLTSIRDWINQGAAE